jgi:glycosyltransferase involved in cell wall biosynthesis
MKILALTNLYPPHYLGGYELCCSQITEALRRRGHTVEILTSNHLTGQAPDPGAPEPGVERRLRIHGYFGHPWLGIRALRALEFHNHQTLRAAAARCQPDLVHVWNLGGLSKSLCLTLQRLNLPVAYHVMDHWIARSLVADVWLDWWNRPHSSPAARLLRAFWTWTGARRHWSLLAPTDPVAAIRFPRLYFCSRALRELTAAKGYAVGHGEVIYAPVNSERFTGEPRPATQPLGKLLYVGRLAEDKGVMTALKAMVQVQGRFPGELCIYGKGDAAYTAQLQALVAEHRLPVSFHSAGPDAMPGVYRAHDALLFTSEWEEPFALTPLEAMASGLPVIGTTTGGSKELLRHGVNSLTYAAGNPEDLAQRILELAGSGGLRARLAGEAHAEVRARFSEPVIAGQIEAYLAETLRLAHRPATL